MTQSLAGLLALNALFAVAGASVVWALGGAATWPDLIRLGGVAYLLGLAAVVTLCTFVLVLGGPVDVSVIAAVALGTAAAAGVAGARFGRRRPTGAPRASSKSRREPFRLVGLGCAALTVLYLANLFRAARLQSQFTFFEWDVWNSWTTKAKSFYFFDGLDPDVYGTFFMSGYPIFVPTLEAMAFHFMGTPDTTTLHVQFWLLVVGFVAAVGGLLRPAVPLMLVWPFLLLFVLLPELNRHGLAPQADATLDVLFAVGALLVALWITRREPWLLGSAAILFAGAASAKREGLLLVAALLAGALAATWRDRRGTWPPLVAVGAATVLVALPWELWRRAHDLPGQLSDSSAEVGLDRLGAAAGSVAQILFDYDLWLVTAPLGVIAAGLALTTGDRRVGVLYAVTAAIVAAGFAWVLAAGVEYTVGAHTDENPIPRASGALALLTIALAPLMLAGAAARPGEGSGRRQR
jgi:hypothetical protein